jgi:EAL domain-containing protein (putative c-di-GMP-specific phosphodiesterase class I)
MQQEVLGALVEVADRIGGAVIGEAVESADEARVLAECGARYAQGHHFAAPTSARRSAGIGAVL